MTYNNFLRGNTCLEVSKYDNNMICRYLNIYRYIWGYRNSVLLNTVRAGNSNFTYFKALHYIIYVKLNIRIQCNILRKLKVDFVLTSAFRLGSLISV